MTFNPLRFMGATLTLALLLLTGCAQLPTQVVRPPSMALDARASATTPFATLVAERRRIAKAKSDSGFVLLDGPASAYASRLALTEGASKTLDLQYYAIHADESTDRLFTAVRAAAARGVKVRVLLDDFHSTGRDARVLALALTPGVQIRLFNPLAGPRNMGAGRLLLSLADAGRIQQRMHNKLYLADNVLGITGGRNLGSAYFGDAADGNFVDLDVLAAGPVVREMSASFDRYWNDKRAYPVLSLVSRKTLVEDHKKEQANAEENAQTAHADGATPTSAAAETTRADPAARAAWQQPAADLSHAEFTWAPAVLVSDHPDKIAAPTPGPDASASDGSSSGGGPGVQKTRNDPVGGAGQALGSGDTVVDGLLQLIGLARTDLLVISPYFVPGEKMMRALSEARARGVRIRVLTNSLASNDAPVAFVGYARHREALLKLGLELYELHSEGGGSRSATGSSGNVTGDSRSMLHSKVLVLDGKLLVIGTMNLDLRSENENTELALLIRSTALSAQAGQLIEGTMTHDAWQVQLDPQAGADGSNLVWRAPRGSDLQDAHSEPGASWRLRLLVKLIGPLAPDSML